MCPKKQWAFCEAVLAGSSYDSDRQQYCMWVFCESVPFWLELSVKLRWQELSKRREPGDRPTAQQCKWQMVTEISCHPSLSSWQTAPNRAGLGGPILVLLGSTPNRKGLGGPILILLRSHSESCRVGGVLSLSIWEPLQIVKGWGGCNPFPGAGEMGATPRSADSLM